MFNPTTELVTELRIWMLGILHLCAICKTSDDGKETDAVLLPLCHSLALLSDGLASSQIIFGQLNKWKFSCLKAIENSFIENNIKNVDD